MSACGGSEPCRGETELEDLRTFVDETNNWIDQTLATLGWTREHIVKSVDLVECPVNAGHAMMHQSLDKHLKYCPLTSRGYSRNEIDAEQSSKFCYADSPLVVSVDLDETALRNILETTGAAVPRELPATMTRALTTLSPAVRRRIYDYCVEVARSTNMSSRIADEQLTLLEDTRSERPLSKLEMLAKMRDMKRRRQSYRGKSTHTANKNYTEVMRDVLNNQMELLANIWAEEAKEMEEKKIHKAREQRAKDSATERHRRRSRSKSPDKSGRRRRSESRESSRRGRHRDDSKKDRLSRSPSRKRKHSKSRSRSRSHTKHKYSRPHHRHEDQEAGFIGAAAEK